MLGEGESDEGKKGELEAKEGWEGLSGTGKEGVMGLLLAWGDVCILARVWLPTRGFLTLPTAGILAAWGRSGTEVGTRTRTGMGLRDV